MDEMNNVTMENETSMEVAPVESVVPAEAENPACNNDCESSAGMSFGTIVKVGAGAVLVGAAAVKFGIPLVKKGFNHIKRWQRRSARIRSQVWTLLPTLWTKHMKAMSLIMWMTCAMPSWGSLPAAPIRRRPV